MQKRDSWRDRRVADEYDAKRFQTSLQRWKHRRDEELLLRLLRAVPSGGRVLDMPCGTGRFDAVLARAGYDVVGADVSLEMMTAGPAEEGVARAQASAFRLPFRTGAFDAAVCVRFLFHLDDRAERIAVLSELARASTGLVIGQVRFRGTWKHAGRFARSRVGLSRRYRPSHSRADIDAELNAAGLELVELVPVSRLFSDKAFVVGRRR